MKKIIITITLLVLLVGSAFAVNNKAVATYGSEENPIVYGRDLDATEPYNFTNLLEGLEEKGFELGNNLFVGSVSSYSNNQIFVSGEEMGYYGYWSTLQMEDNNYYCEYYYNCGKNMIHVIVITEGE